MASEEFLHSFALFDADGRLVDWDEGFAGEWHYAAAKLVRGVAYVDLLRAALSNTRTIQFIVDNYAMDDREEFIRKRVEGFGTDRSHEYRMPSGRIIHIDEHRTVSGGVRRLARDVTEEHLAEDALVQAQQRLDATDSDIGGVFTESRRTPNGSYIFPAISESLVQLLDLPGELVGQDPMMIYARMITNDEEDKRRAEAMEQAAQNLSIYSMDYRIRDGKERVRWIRQSMMPRREADGTVIFSGVMRDITREKEAEDQVELLRSIVVRSYDSIVVFESEGSIQGNTKILYVNEQFTALFGGDAGDLIGQPMQKLDVNNFNEIGSKLISAAQKRDDGKPVEFESLGVNGRIFWVEARVETVQKFDSGVFRWVVISRDVTERRRAQEELLRAKEAAEAGNRAKSNFLANMSHELRTPLNAIIGFTELIEHGVKRTGWVPSYAEYLTDVSESGRHLLELINTILDLSKIESGSLELNRGPVDLKDLVETSLALVSVMAQTGGVTLSAEFPDKCPEITGDFLKLKQVMLNILSNAIKFTSVGGTVTTRISFTNAEAVIEVTDTGCGISETDLERVLLPFVQAENSLARRFPGSGLGLSIARELCGLHHGRLAISSVEDEGTTVRIYLPR